MSKKYFNVTVSFPLSRNYRIIERNLVRHLGGIDKYDSGAGFGQRDLVFTVPTKIKAKDIAQRAEQFLKLQKIDQTTIDIESFLE